MPDILNCDLEIRITRESNNLISISWPEQYIVEGNGPIAVNYARQGTGRLFSVNDNSIEVHQNANEVDLGKWPMPESVTIDGAGRIIVIITKRIFTSTGWTTVKTTTLYERYTMTT